MLTAMSRQLICSALELAMNSGRQLLVEQQKTLARLNGQSLAVTIKEWQFPIQVEVHDQTFSVRSPDKVTADCHISCDLDTLPKLKEKHTLTKLIREEKLDLDGDIDVAQRFAALANEQNIDIEEWLSGFTGDSIAYKLNQGGKQFKQKLDAFFQRGRDDIKDYLVDEISVMPEQNEYRQFADAVDDMSLALARLEAKLNTLYNRAQSKN